MRYYFRGPDHASWSWYYPFYHAPMAFDLAQYDKLGNPEIALEMGQVFKPFQQLMAVLPDSSKTLLPECYQWLFGSNSPVANFYPRKFVVDMDGVKTPWGGMTLSFGCSCLRFSSTSDSKCDPVDSFEAKDPFHRPHWLVVCHGTSSEERPSSESRRDQTR